jgi:hypothetical protein
VALSPIEIEPADVVEGIKTVTCWLPSTGIMKGEGGEEVAPCGNPVIATFTAPLKPLCPTIEITNGGVIVPTVIESADGVIDKLKSCAGGGLNEPPPPQPHMKNMAANATQAIAKGLLEMHNLLCPSVISASTGYCSAGLP